MHAPAAAGAVLELGEVVHPSSGFCFFLIRKVFVFVVALPQAASR